LNILLSTFVINVKVKEEKNIKPQVGVDKGPDTEAYLQGVYPAPTGRAPK
jgi:hypothetical protein